jgi:hypothetical protein
MPQEALAAATERGVDRAAGMTPGAHSSSTVVNLDNGRLS